MGIYQKDGKFYIDYYYQKQRIRECVGVDKRMAEKALAVRRGEILQGRFGIRKRVEVRFDSFAKTYLDYAKTNKRSWVRDEYLLKNLLPFFGNRLLSDITPFLIESYKKRRAAEVKPATVNREIALLKHMYNLAIKWGRATSNPMRDVKRFHEEDIPERILSQEESAKLLEACTEYSRPIVLTALHTGMRLGEVLGLTWAQVDLGQRVITILHSKNGKPRKIPINETLLQALLTLKYNSKSESVFVCARTGGPAHAFRTAWLNALQRAGVPRCRFHDLRHTFASRLVAAGVDLVTVKELLGHSNITMTSRYAHSAPESKRRAVAFLEDNLGAQEAGNRHFLDTQDNLPKKTISISH